MYEVACCSVVVFFNCIAEYLYAAGLTERVSCCFSYFVLFCFFDGVASWTDNFKLNLQLFSSVSTLFSSLFRLRPWKKGTRSHVSEYGSRTHSCIVRSSIYGVCNIYYVM